MLKKLFERYGAIVLICGILFGTFAAGYVVGKNSRNAPNVDVDASDYVSATTSEKTEPTITNLAEPVEKITALTVTATAYCPCAKCCGKSDGITATGTKATAGRTIAVDPSVIPYGTEVIINGITYVAEDCGGAITGNKIDIFFDNHEDALIFGKQTLIAYIKTGEAK